MLWANGMCIRIYSEQPHHPLHQSLTRKAEIVSKMSEIYYILIAQKDFLTCKNTSQLNLCNTVKSDSV
jgi:hypothetical protein